MLNPKQEKFCLEYIRTANATAAYQTAFEITSAVPVVIKDDI